MALTTKHKTKKQQKTIGHSMCSIEIMLYSGNASLPKVIGTAVGS
jgi:hypothetical protein